MVDLTGAADLHCHFGPDPRFARSVSALEAAQEAAAAGHSAIVLKSHAYPTAALATVIDGIVGGVSVFGGVCCDHEVGGVNPAAVESALALGAKIVWLPTLSSVADARSGLAAQLGITDSPCAVVGDDGELVPAARDVLDLVAASDAILATGHISAEEHFAVAAAFGATGRLLVTHALEAGAGPNLSVGECVALADIGAIIELCAMTCVGSYASRSFLELAACIAAVGADRCVVSSDFGQAVNPHPAIGLQQFADGLVAAGVKPDDVRLMACERPRRLLGLVG